MEDAEQRASLDRARRYEYVATALAVAAAIGSAASGHWLWFAIDGPVAMLFLIDAARYLLGREPAANKPTTELPGDVP